MSQHLLRVAAAMATLVGGAMSLSATAAPHPSIRVQVIESAPEHSSTAPAPQAVLTDSVSEAPSVAAPTPTEPAKETAMLDTPQLDAETVDVEPVVEVEVSSAAPVPIEPLATVWRVNVEDMTVRQALSRWAMEAGWIDHWELDIDIPLTASATLATTPDFTVAVQQLAEAVALSETPFRPCFYSNKVVRIVPYNAMCDRTMARPARG